MIEAAEAMRDESQNALLKTLEEPPPHAHLILLSAELESLLETISSRCQQVRFAPLPAAADRESRWRAPRSPSGWLPRPTWPPVTSSGRASCSPSPVPGSAPMPSPAPRQRWPGPSARRLGVRCSPPPRRPGRRPRRRPARRSRKRRSVASAARPGRRPRRRARSGRRRRTEVLDLGLELCAAWLRDLVAVGAGAEGVVFNRDRLDQLRRSARGPRSRPGRRGGRAGQRVPPPARPERLRGASPRGSLLQARVAARPRRLSSSRRPSRWRPARGRLAGRSPAPAPGPAW